MEVLTAEHMGFCYGVRRAVELAAAAPGQAGAPGDADSVRGGRQNIWTFGATWYDEPGARLLLNYQIVDVARLNPAWAGDPEPFGPSPETPPTGAGIGQSYQVLSMRAQVSF